MVLIGIFGLDGSGRHTTASIICEMFGFRMLAIRPKNSDGQVPSINGITDTMNHFPLNTEFFSSLQEAADYAMNDWREHFVLVGVECNEATIDIFKRRPTFLIISVTAPGMSRLARLGNSEELESFFRNADQVVSDPCYYEIIQMSKIIISNDGTLDDLKNVIVKLNLNDPSWLRPNWDTYFMQLAELASKRSNCMKRRVGAIIVQDCKVVATGYNGTPRGLLNCNAGGCPRCNRNAKCGQSLDDCLCLHAEENAMLEAGSPRIQGATIYSTSTPCIGCAKKIVQVGIKRVVFAREYSLEHNVQEIFDRAAIKLEKISDPVLKRHISCTAPGFL